jgi:hypothetical protein
LLVALSIGDGDLFLLASRVAHQTTQHPTDQLTTDFAANLAGCTFDELFTHAGPGAPRAAAEEVAQSVE